MKKPNLFVRIRYWLYHVESVRVEMQVHAGYFVCGKLIHIGEYYWTMGKGGN